jgi:hypothetical protein
MGYISYGGAMDLAITIRTLEIEEGRVAVQELAWDGEGEQRCSLEFPNEANTSAAWFLTNKLANATVT